MSGGLPAPTAAVSFDDKSPQATDSISTRTPGCVRSNSAPISFKTATAFGSTAVCQMRSVVCCCLGVQDEPITTDRARRNTQLSRLLAGFASRIHLLGCALRKVTFGKGQQVYQLTLAQWFPPNAIAIGFLALMLALF